MCVKVHNLKFKAFLNKVFCHLKSFKNLFNSSKINLILHCNAGYTMIIRNVKDLKSLCITSFINAKNISTDLIQTTNLKHLLLAFKKLGPTLSQEVYSKFFGKKEANFESFIWFLYNFVWDSKKTKLSISDSNESILTNWTFKDYQSLSEVVIVGRYYTAGKMCIAFQNYCQYQLEVKKLNLRLVRACT